MRGWIGAFIGILVFATWSFADDSLPHLQKVGNVTQLIVDGKPYIIFGGQVINPSGFADRMALAWPKLKDLHANSVEVPFYWENIEPEQGKFDFGNVDQIIKDARSNGFHLIPLWFGTWKNGTMDYVPTWVKNDPAKFARVMDIGGRPMRVLSPMCKATEDADCNAFAALMKHLKEFDGTQHTVLMIQVENESGIYGSVRDYSQDATRLFNGPVPDDLVNEMHKSPGTWKEVFSNRLAEESFTTYYLSGYINAVAAAGKAQYPLLTYCNCWMGGDGTNDRFQEFDRPGDSYPSGGPVTHMLDLWKANAPSIDIIGPDIYHRNSEIYRTILSRYSRADNPLMIVETGGDMHFAQMMFYALADHSAIGFTSYGADAGLQAGLGANYQDVANNFRVLTPVREEIAQLQASGKLKCAVEEDAAPGKMLNFDGYDVLCRFRPPTRSSAAGIQPTGPLVPSGRLLVGQLSQDEFLVAGFDAAVDFKPEQGSEFTGGAQVLHAERGGYENGTWKATQILNGDLTTGGLICPSDGAVIHVKLMRY